MPRILARWLTQAVDGAWVICVALSTNRVLTMEWVDGVRLTDEAELRALGLSPASLVDTLVQSSLRQMLGNGFFHADPHAGNLLVRPDGTLVYLDFGMMSFLEPTQRFAIIEAAVHPNPNPAPCN